VVLGGSCAEFMLIGCSVSPARMEALAFYFFTIPPRIYKEIMSHIDKEKQKLVARIKRIRGQVDSIERSLTAEDDCADVLMLLANVRGGINSLMAEVLEDHIRHHLLSPERSSAPPHELAEDMIDLVRSYLK
jgi:FrmR/RcnR family transcriptional regulator, repressor of rcnA expression